MSFLKRRITISGIRLEGEDAKNASRVAHEVIYGKGRGRIFLSYFFLAVTSGLITGLFIYFFILLARAYYNQPPSFVIVLLSTIVGVIIGITWNRFWLIRRRRYLRREMACLGYDLCSECGYWLKGLSDTSTRCPECGAERQQIDSI